MTSVPYFQGPDQDLEAPRSVCPSCGLDGNGHRIPGRVPTAQYLCPTGLHLWSVQWFAEEVA